MDRLYLFFKQYKIVWVEGHHNDGFSPPGADLRIEYAYLNLNFRHIASDKEDFELPATITPAIKCTGNAKPFQMLYHGQNKIVVPSFNCNARAININEPVIQTLFRGRQRIPIGQQIQALCHHG